MKPQLNGVPETALWTLHHRAAEARRPDRLLDDPAALDLIERIDYPFAERFGAGFPAQAQIQALRALTFDREVLSFLDRHPDGTVVALGEGLETQFWRVDNGRVRWLTVELPASARLRERLLPPEPRRRVHAGSALELSWMDRVDPAAGVLITAQGLLMYLPVEQAHGLIAACARRFPGAGFVFDAVPRWMGRAVERGAGQQGGYRPPPLRWCLDSGARQSLLRVHPAIAGVRDCLPPRGRGALGWLLGRLHLVPVLRHHRPAVLALSFAA